MATLAFLHSVKRYSPGQFSLLRIALGLWLAWHFGSLAPWAPELLSSAGVLAEPAAAGAEAGTGAGRGLPFNPLRWLDAPWFAVLWCLLGAALGLLLALGWRRVPVALALALVWAALLDAAPLLAYPSTPYTGFLLLLFALVPDGEPWRWRGRPRPPAEWGLPAGVFFAAWAMLALGYAFSALGKLQSPSWLEGGAIGQLLQDPLARTGWLRDTVLAWPEWVRAGLGWGLLAVELAFLPLALWRRTRAWAWSLALVVQVLLCALSAGAALAPGLVLLHALAFDPNWLPPRARPGRHPVLFYDGECGLCNAVVRFLLREDDRAVLRFAPLQGRTGQRTLKRFRLPQEDFDSLLYLPDLDGDRRYLRTRGAIGVLDLLGGPWRVLAWLAWPVPGPLRDLAYRLVARTRYALFGVYVPTPLPEPKWADRFVADEGS